jgi:Excalibur calcium-binding domain
MALATGVAVAALAIWVTVASGAANTPGCSSFASQAEAQEHFTQVGGRPARDVEGLDGDGDGVACEGSPGPYAGFATIAYNLKRKFFYGVATMPRTASGDTFACLAGNRHYADGPRLLKVYREARGEDVAVSRTLGAEAKSSGGHLIWKLEKDLGPGGRYYAAFEEQVRLSPYKPSECPEFRSPARALP